MALNNSLSSICPVIAYDKESKIFLNDDKTLGFGFICTPLPGSSQELQAQLTSMLTSEFPKGTMMSFMLYRSPDLDSQLNEMLQMRFNHMHELLTPIIVDRVNFLRYHSRNHLVARLGRSFYDSGLIVDVKLIISVKVPVASGIDPSDADMSYVSEFRSRIESSLTECGFGPQTMTAEAWIRVMSTLFNWGDNASWRNTPTVWQEDVPLNEQFYDNDSDLDDTDPTRSFIGISSRYFPKEEDPENVFETFVQMLSPKTFPQSMWFGNAIRYVGDFSGQDKTVKENYAVIMHLYFPDHDKQKGFYSRKRQVTAKFSQSPLARLQPALQYAQQDLDNYTEDLSQGAKALKMSMSVMMFAPTKKRLISASTAIQQQFEIDKFKILPDKYVQREMFFNSLPMCGEIKFLFGNESKRTLAVTSNTALAFLPIFSEWKGTGTPHIALISRTGQLMTVSLHDSQTNKNAVIAAESGSGKSFYTNELLTMYMSEGAKCWVIDIGRSYAKLCESLKGEFICFDESKSPCLNCFELVKDYNEENGSLLAILQTMIAPNSILTDQQNAILARVLDEQFTAHGNSLSIDIIAQALQAEAIRLNDMRIQDMATQLYQFTSQGQFGKYFNGKNNITFNSDFTVLELEELSGRPNLRKVVLLQLIFQIQQAVFLSKDRSQKKIVMIDEGWDLLKEGQSVKFMEHAYRKFRKYNGSMIIATQSLNDLYSSADAGKAIAENSAFYFLLRQKPETVEQVKQEKRLDMGEGGYKMLKSVNTVAGAFSELFVKSGAGSGVGRLIVSDFQKLLYSTTPEDLQAINNYVARGLNYTQAINKVLIDRGLYHDLTPQHGQNPVISVDTLKDVVRKKFDVNENIKGEKIMEIANIIYDTIEEMRIEKEKKEELARAKAEAKAAAKATKAK